MKLVLQAGNVCAVACVVLALTGQRLAAAVTFTVAMACLALDWRHRRRRR